MTGIRPITPCLWFDNQAEEAAHLYTGIFPSSRITQVLRYGEAGHDIHGQPAGGDPKAQQCGWLKDRFGLSWQVTPTVLIDMLADPDKVRSQRAMEAMLEMKMFNIAELERVFRG